MQLGTLFKAREWAYHVQWKGTKAKTDGKATGFDILKESANIADPYINNWALQVLH